MENFLEETKKAIRLNKHKIKDVMFIGTSDGKKRMSWNEFKIKANFNYYSGYGTAEINYDLIVYFKDNTYMFRNEYDGSEWWEYRVSKLFKENDNFEILENIKQRG